MKKKMNQIESMEGIASYIAELKIKKSIVGGFDRTDVYMQLQQLHEIYQKVIDVRVEEYRQKEQEAIAEADAARKKIEKLTAELEMQKRVNRELPVVPESPVIKGPEMTAPSVPLHSEVSTDERLDAILAEASLARDRIIAAAKEEGEKERIKIRAEFRYESKKHEKWKVLAQAEKRKLDELISEAAAGLLSTAKKVEELKHEIDL